ncbi:MAG: DUF2190 family protein [Gemmatimonadota bacterium]|nr:MAG: DUF2190 family protein [Gemmatimonadota bacterium]
MATDMQLVSDVTFEAAADLSTKQFYFVKLSAANTVDVCSGATDVPCGILQNKPSAAGRPAVVRMFGISKAVADAGLSVGALIGTAADGQADAKVAGTDTTQYVVGVALTACSNAGEIVEVSLNCMNPHRAA